MVAKEASAVKFISIYGYAYFVYIIAAFLAMIPNELVQWVVLLYAGVTSVCHLCVCANK